MAVGLAVAVTVAVGVIVAVDVGVTVAKAVVVVVSISCCKHVKNNAQMNVNTVVWNVQILATTCYLLPPTHIYLHTCMHMYKHTHTHTHTHKLHLKKECYKLSLYR